MQVLITRISAEARVPPIKAVRALTGMGLREAKDICDAVHQGHPQVINTKASWQEVVATCDSNHVLEYYRQPTPDLRTGLVTALGAMPRHLTVQDVLDVLRAVGG